MSYSNELAFLINNRFFLFHKILEQNFHSTYSTDMVVTSKRITASKTWLNNTTVRMMFAQTGWERGGMCVSICHNLFIAALLLIDFLNISPQFHVLSLFYSLSTDRTHVPAAFVSAALLRPSGSGADNPLVVLFFHGGIMMSDL